MAYTSPHKGRLSHPRHGPPLGEEVRVVEGMNFRRYKYSATRAVWISEDFRIKVHRSGDRGLLSVAMDGVYLGAQFRYFHTAVRAASKVMREVDDG